MAEEKTLTSGDNIAIPVAEYTEHQELCELPSTLMKGTEGMQAAGTTYLPQEDGETDAKYATRLQRSTLNNVYGRTIQKMSGEVFGDEVVASEDVNDEIEELLDNIDNKGNDITQFIKCFFECAVDKGINHVLVDYPPTVGKTKAEHKKAGARPYWVEVKPEQIIGWRTEMQGGKKVLTQLRLKETVKVPDGKYGMKEMERIRLFEPGSYEIHEKDEDGNWAIGKDEKGEEKRGVTSLNFIPLVSLRLGDELSHLTNRPPLMDLAHLNRAHWESSSDQRNILHYARLVTYFGKMLDVDSEGKVVFGANRLVHANSPDADLKVVEHTGKGIEAGRQDLKDLETSMALFGLTLMLPKAGAVTATEKDIDKSENDSALKGWVRSLNGSLKTLLEYTAAWLGVDNSGELKANDDFKTVLRNTDATVLLEAYKINLLPREMIFEEFKRRSIITQDLEYQDLLDQLESDQKSSGTMSDLFGTDSGELLGQSQTGQQGASE